MTTPREAFVQSSHVFTHVPRMAVYPRILEDFAPLDVLRTANFETWRKLRFDQLTQQELAKVISDRSDYATFIQVKTANNSTFDLLVASFPHNGNRITHTADELPSQIQDDLFDAVGLTADAMRVTAVQQGTPLVRLYVGEQFFFDELNNYPFKNTFPQTHIHVSGITQEDFAKTTQPTYEDFYQDPQVKHVFRDPTIFVAQDIYRELFPDENPVLDTNTASLIISKEQLGDHLEISPASRKKYIGIMRGFKDKYKEIAACFTDGTKDRYGRHVPLPRGTRLANLEEYIHAHPSLTINSQLVLRHIADNLRDFDPDNLATAFYNSFAGHIGWTFNFDDRTVTLRFAPRAYTESHGYGETDGEYFVIKDRNRRLSDEEKKAIFESQRAVIQNAQQLL